MWKLFNFFLFLSRSGSCYLRILAKHIRDFTAISINSSKEEFFPSLDTILVSLFFDGSKRTWETKCFCDSKFIAALSSL
jgi:hypothetical protein